MSASDTNLAAQGHFGGSRWMPTPGSSGLRSFLERVHNKDLDTSLNLFNGLMGEPSQIGVWELK